MKNKYISFVQYTEAIIARGLIKIFLRPTIRETENLKELATLKNNTGLSVVIIANHINDYDPVYISSEIALATGRSLYPVFIPAKKRFFDKPLKRFFMLLHGALPIGIGRDEDSLNSLKNIIEKVKSAHTVCVFPEGQVSTDGTIGKDLGFVSFLARRSSLIVQPVYLSGLKGCDVDWRNMLLRKRRLTMIFGKPITVAQGSSVESMAMITEAGENQ